MVVIMKILGSTELQAFEILRQRLSNNDGTDPFADAILEIDEAASCMDRNDVETITNEQKATVARQEAARAFSEDSRDRLRAAVVAVALAAPAVARRPVRPPDLDLAELRRWVPPRSSI